MLDEKQKEELDALLKRLRRMLDKCFYLHPNGNYCRGNPIGGSLNCHQCQFVDNMEECDEYRREDDVTCVAFHRADLRIIVNALESVEEISVKT